MLKVATVFSGIGAVEQALKRMNVKHEIIFACDNGGVDLVKIKEESLSKISLQEKINLLKEEIKEIEKKDDYLKILRIKLEKQEKNLKELENFKLNIKKNDYLKILKILEKESKKFQNFKVSYDEKLEKLIENYLFKIYDYTTLSNLKKINNNELTELVKKLKNDESVKKLKRYYSEINLELNQIRQEIETQIHIKKIAQIEDYEEKKLYVDNLYEGRKVQNNVMKSYLSNYELDYRDFHWNISLLDGKKYKGNVDLFVGGSPCQSFSMAGKRKGFEDTRGTLFYEFVRLVNEVEPRFFIYENVKGLLNHDKGETWKIVKNTFKKLNYKYKVENLNALDFKIPQRRERIFVLGCKYEEDFEKLEEIKKEIRELSMLDFILDNNTIFLPGKDIFFNKLDAENLKNINNWCEGLVLTETQKNFVANCEKLKKKYTQINGEIMLTQRANQQYNLHGDFIEYDFKKLILSEKVKKYVLDSESSYNKKELEKEFNAEIAKTIVASCHKMHRASVDNYLCYGHKETPLNERIIRKLHPRECLRLMGFRDDFKIVVPATEAYRQAGNSIVVDVLIGILESMKNVLKIDV